MELIRQDTRRVFEWFEQQEERARLEQQEERARVLALYQAQVARTVDWTLPDGTTGYAIRNGRTDDCFAAAIATTLCVPISDVPDPRIDARLASGEDPVTLEAALWQDLETWLRERGDRLTFHHDLDSARKMDRWIGVAEMPGSFRSHCLVMHFDTLLFDPIRPLAPDGKIAGRQTLMFQPSNITFGLSFDKTKDD